MQVAKMWREFHRAEARRLRGENQVVKNPKWWWKWVKKLKLVDKRADKVAIIKVYYVRI